MKFEKFFKSVGTHGLIVKRNDAENWLVCGNAGMKIPRGVNNFGVSCEPEPIFKAIVNSTSDDDILTLKEAVIFEPDGKASDIVRVFETELGDRVGIYNADYGLLEKKDYLTYLEVESESKTNPGKSITTKLVVVRDQKGEVVGFIGGMDRI